MKNILIVMSTLYNGGAEKSLVNFLNELPEDKYSVDLLLFKKKGMFLTQVPEFVNILEIPNNLKKLYSPTKKAGNMFLTKVIGTGISNMMHGSKDDKRGFRWKYFYTKKIEKIDRKYDVALAYISGEIMYFVDEKVDADKKIVWIHNDYRSARHSRKYDAPYFKNMDYIVSISDSCVDIMKEEFPEHVHKMRLLPNITSSVVINRRANEFYPEEYDKSGINILSVGRLHEQKGFDIAIEATRLLKESGQKFKWFVIGSGELEEKLKKQISEAGVEDSFILLGTRENPYPYIKNCTIFVQPSRYEGKSVVIDEAKILSCPILATNYPTVKDQLIDGVEGKVVEMDKESLAKGIGELIADESARRLLHSQLSSRNYGNQDEIENYINLIEY